MRKATVINLLTRYGSNRNIDIYSPYCISIQADNHFNLGKYDEIIPCYLFTNS